MSHIHRFQVDIEQWYHEARLLAIKLEPGEGAQPGLAYPADYEPMANLRRLAQVIAALDRQGRDEEAVRLNGVFVCLQKANGPRSFEVELSLPQRQRPNPIKAAFFGPHVVSPLAEFRRKSLPAILSRR